MSFDTYNESGTRMEEYECSTIVNNKRRNLSKSAGETKACHHRPFSQVAISDGDDASDDSSYASEERSRIKSKDFSCLPMSSSSLPCNSRNHNSTQRILCSNSSKTDSFIHSSTKKPWWACDYCNMAAFHTYHEALTHEQTCSMNKSKKTGGDSSTCSGANNNVFLFASTKDVDSLSDRQCYVRSNFVEVFAAADMDVAVRHSRGAQKLYEGQIGIRCIYCTNAPPKKRGERAVCYPSCISRIYQTVADMCRFHFTMCSAIPEEIKQTYFNTKTTRPRGVGSPQSYWITSAQELGLVDSDRGIRYVPSPSLQPAIPTTTTATTSTPSSVNEQRRRYNDVRIVASLLPKSNLIRLQNINNNNKSNPGIVTDTTSHSTSPSLIASPPFSPTSAKLTPTSSTSSSLLRANSTATSSVEHVLVPQILRTATTEATASTLDEGLTEASMLLLLRNHHESPLAVDAPSNKRSLEKTM